MKKILSILLLIVILSFSACGNDTKKTESSNTSSASTDEIIEDASENSNKSKKITDKKDSSLIDKKNIKNSSSTKKATAKPKKTSAPKYELQIKYKNISDFKNKIVKYKKFSDLLKQVDKKQNAECLNPFRQENLMMLFEDKKAYAPIYPKDCTDNGCYLSSANYFCFKFSEKGSAYTLKIYTINNNNILKTNKYNLSFKSKQGIDIYKNKDGKYCWFLDDKYVVIYSGSSRDFVNNIFFSQIYINY